MSALAIAVLLLFPTDARAQLAWDAPFLLPPEPPAGIGIFLAVPAFGDPGVLLTWRPEQGRAVPGWGYDSHGLRAGIAETETGTAAVFGGVDVAGLLVREGTEVPFEMGWAAGGGLSIGDGIRVGIPVALTFSGTIDVAELRLTPYASPRVTLDFASDGPEDDGLELQFSFDLGLDIGFGEWALGLGGTLLDHDAVAIGIIL